MIATGSAKRLQCAAVAKSGLPDNNIFAVLMKPEPRLDGPRFLASAPISLARREQPEQ
jgi:hypothetical protein